MARTVQRLTNAAFTGPGGALGAGDRGANSYVPQYTGNPHDSNDFVYRWRQYVHLYETSWEARKIVRIVPEDALRKDWLLEDIPEEAAKAIHSTLEKLQFGNILKRSLMLERLLGGCLTFMGVEGSSDEPDIPLNLAAGGRPRFFNAIPVSRISRVSWETNPLSEHYMRPSKYLINGEDVHISRFLVWDGEPLFDPYDYALTNFRGNLAGFGPSVLATLWDDIVKAIGTRQAAYQLIQTNNAILMAVDGLQDLQGTKSGQAALQKLRQIAQQLSVYNAALVDGNKVDIKQHSASFGSVPELMLTFIQILSAGSDIPATRFLGQAPGGLNATGESDLENYYNVIDAYQRQHIEPQLRRTCDVVGYWKFPKQWAKWREKLTFKFPPLWNASELEEAQRNSQNIDNVMKLFDAGLVDELKVIQEINAKGALSVNLDESDISLVETAGIGPGPTPGEIGHETPRQEAEQPNLKQETQRLRNVVAVRNADSTSLLIKAAGFIPETVDHEQFLKGFEVEQEHADTVGGDKVTIAKIVLDHLEEDVEYYTKLERVENAVVHYQKGADKHRAACNTPMGVRGEQTTTTDPSNVTCAKCRAKLAGKFGFPKVENTDKKLPPRDPETGEFVSVYHGGHISASESVLKEGIKRPGKGKDSETVSVALRPDTAYGYAAMSGHGGESGWSEKAKPGKRPKPTPAEERQIYHIKVPKEWHEKNLAQRLYEGTPMEEYRYKADIPPEFIKKSDRFGNAIHLDQLPEPTPAQIHSGNYKKHHLKLHGLDISIENPRGSTRRGTGPDGTPWESVLPAHYGYVKRTEGADGDHVDVYLGPYEESELVFVVDQTRLDDGEFDEHKCIFGALSSTQAKEIYLAGFSDGKGAQRMKALTPMHVSHFKQWLAEGDTKQPYAKEGGR
jgi:Uncharacterized protein conserved in bacteria